MDEIKKQAIKLLRTNSRILFDDKIRLEKQLNSDSLGVVGKETISKKLKKQYGLIKNTEDAIALIQQIKSQPCQ